MITISFVNRTGRRVRYAPERWRVVADKAVRLYGPVMRPGMDLSVVFVTPAEARRLNRVYRKKSKVANVLSFAGERADELGDIIICPAAARAERKDLLHLFGHGLLHLLGFAHETASSARSMEQAETKILS